MMQPQGWIALLIVLVLAGIHLFSTRLRFLDVIPRSRWLSLAGGVSVGYVFVHLLPELGRKQEDVAKVFAEQGFLKYHVYVMALVGLVVFYGLERLVRGAKEASGPGEGTGAGVFWLHIGSFGLYNALVGYLLTERREGGLVGMLLFGLAMALHFVVNDFGLLRDHRAAYVHKGRWVLAMGVLAGWVVGHLTSVHPAILGLLFAFLAGGVVLNVLKEELPEERQSSFLAFLAGAAGYAVLLLAI